MTTLQLTLLVGLFLSNSPEAADSKPTSKYSDALSNLSDYEGCWVGVEKSDTFNKNWLIIDSQSLLRDSVRVSKYHVERSKTSEDKTPTVYEALVIFSKDNDGKTRAHVLDKNNKKPVEYEAFSGGKRAVMVGPFQPGVDVGKRDFIIKYLLRNDQPDYLEFKFKEKKEEVTLQFKKGSSCPPSPTSSPAGK